MPTEESPSIIVPASAEDREWSELLSPTRRKLFANAGLMAGGLAVAGAPGNARAATSTPVKTTGTPLPANVGTSASGVLLPIKGPSRSEWGYETVDEATPPPPNVRPDEQPLPALPRPWTAINSYHAHIYFDEDNYEKAALIRRWVSERFPVELGNWNLEPRGPHVTPSFYFGFTTELQPIIVPWLQLNSLGLTILIHPNTGDPRSDHLYYALWVNRTQPVNAYVWRRFVDGGGGDVDQINPNVVPTVPLEA
ncbi:MAG: DOPA 4,5-dioxygenase family protein [Pseudoxanthomonas sp.]